ncbi:MAG: NAD(+) synthase [Coriobacteriales bacterium]|jgi:NAD+ synthetase|nr:NAD(+) synthase [Coriobacteriales bacterium]
MYVAIVQNNPTVGALRANAAQVLETLDALAASAYPPDLVVLPSCALTGAPLDGLCHSDAFMAEALDVARLFMEKAPLPTLVGTLLPVPLEEGAGFIGEPEVLFCRDGEGTPLGFIDPPGQWEPLRYTSSVTVSLDGQTVSVLLDGPPEPTDDFTASDIVIVMLAKEYQGTDTMFTASDQLGYLREVARRNDAWVLAVNLVGAQDDVVYDGASVALAPDGSVVEAAGPFVEQVLSFNIGLERRPGNEEGRLVRPLLPYDADWRALGLCIHDYVRKNGFTDVVIGLSGGIDSAVTAALACDALGAGHVHGVLMPGPYSSEGSVLDATALAANLGIETLSLPIDGPLAAFSALYREVLGQEGSFLARQNIQARIRAVHLMQLSNTFGWLLLNTGNKSEAAMGFSTLYGDTAGALAPLGNTYKTDVYGLAHWRNGRSPVIPVEILEKAPSAELYEGQKDQDSLPPYEVLDRILGLHIEDGLGVDQILEYSRQVPDGTALTEDLVATVLDTVRRAEFKRRQEPLAPVLGTLDMGIDRDWPITNGFTDHSRGLVPDGRPEEYLEMVRGWKRPEGWGFLAN